MTRAFLPAGSAPREMMRELARERRRLRRAASVSRCIADCGSRFPGAVTGEALQQLLTEQIDAHLPREDDLVVDDAFSLPRRSAVETQTYQSAGERGGSQGNPPRRARSASPWTSPERPAVRGGVDGGARADIGDNDAQRTAAAVRPAGARRAVFANSNPLHADEPQASLSRSEGLSSRLGTRSPASMLERALQRYWSGERARTLDAAPISTVSTERVNDSAKFAASGLVANEGRPLIGPSAQTAVKGGRFNGAVQAQRHARRTAVDVADDQREPQTSARRNNMPAVHKGGDLADKMADVLFKQALLHGIDVT